jgi:hypothetical protein
MMSGSVSSAERRCLRCRWCLLRRRCLFSLSYFNTIHFDFTRPGAPYAVMRVGLLTCLLVAHLYDSAIPARRHSSKPFNPRPLISHLTNSNECGNLQVKVLLTVSPVSSSLSPAIRRVPAARFTLLATHHSPLPLYFHQLAASSSLSKKSTPLQSSKSSLFCQNTRGGGIPAGSAVCGDASDFFLCALCASVANPIFSATCRLLVSLASLFRTRTLCFQQVPASFPKNRGVGMGVPSDF